MPSSNDSWGIEVGAHAIKAIRLQRDGNEIAVADYDVIPFKRVLTTPDIDADEAIRVGLDQLMSRHPIGKARVVASVAGHRAFARFAKLPPVEPKRVPDIVKFEAVQQIPFPIDQVEWDYQIFEHPDSPDVEVGIFAITKERVLNWLSNFRAVGVPVHDLTLSPMAIYNALAYDMPIGDDTPGTILMDIGAQATDLMIAEGGRVWMRTIPIGGHHFTEALVRSFKLSYSKAEKIKREAATSKYARQIFQAMRPVFSDLVGEVQKSIGYYQSLTRESELTRLVGMGNTFRLPGLQKFLKQQLQLEVSRLDQFQKIEVEGRHSASFAEHAPELAPAYGLALQGLGRERVSCNLLPTHMVRRQLWRAKQPWNVAAALVMAASAAVATARVWADWQAYRADEQAGRHIQQVIDQANQYVSAWEKIEGGSDPRSRIENLRRILDYRRVWPMILRDIQNAMLATDPQAPLLSGDPQKIKQIPANERRRIFIERIEHEYEYTGESEAWSGQSGPGGAAGPYGPGGPGAGPESFSPTAPSSSTGSSGTSDSSDSDDDEPDNPAFTVRVIGTTPKRGVSQFLNNTFMDWLQQREQQMKKEGRNRPYRISKVELKEITPLRELEEDQRGGPSRQAPGPQGGPSEGRPPGRGAPGGRSLPGAPAGVRNLPGVAGPPGASAEGLPPGASPGGDGGDAVNDKKINQLMPSHPLANRDRSGDRRFVIEWRVELIRPEQARQTDRQQEPAEPDSSGDPLADAENRR